MRILALISGLFIALSAQAQFSVQESDSTNSLSILGGRWNTNFFSLASTETDKMYDDGGRLATYNYFTFSNYVAQDYRFGLRIPFQFNTAGTDRFNRNKVNPTEMFLQDIILSLQNYNILYLPWDLGLYWEGRVYLPTSPHSKKTGLITRLRNQFILSKVFSKHWEIEYDQKFSYYFQSRAAYRNQFEDADGFMIDTPSLTKRSELEHWVQVWGKITSKFGIGWKLGGEHTQWNSSQAEARNNEDEKTKAHEHLIKTGPSVRFPLSDSVNFIFTYEDKVNRDKNLSELGQFRAQNTQFTLLSFVRF